MKLQIALLLALLGCLSAGTPIWAQAIPVYLESGQSAGQGLLIKPSSRTCYAITAAHVVDPPADKVSLTTNEGQILSGTVAYKETKWDHALIKIYDPDRDIANARCEFARDSRVRSSCKKRFNLPNPCGAIRGGMSNYRFDHKSYDDSARDLYFGSRISTRVGGVEKINLKRLPHDPSLSFPESVFLRFTVIGDSLLQGDSGMPVWRQVRGSSGEGLERALNASEFVGLIQGVKGNEVRVLPSKALSHTMYSFMNRLPQGFLNPTQRDSAKIFRGEPRRGGFIEFFSGVENLPRKDGPTPLYSQGIGEAVGIAYYLGEDDSVFSELSMIVGKRRPNIKIYTTSDNRLKTENWTRLPCRTDLINNYFKCTASEIRAASHVLIVLDGKLSTTRQVSVAVRSF